MPSILLLLLLGASLKAQGTMLQISHQPFPQKSVEARTQKSKVEITNYNSQYFVYNQGQSSGEIKIFETLGFNAILAQPTFLSTPICYFIHSMIHSLPRLSPSERAKLYPASSQPVPFLILPLFKKLVPVNPMEYNFHYKYILL